MTISNGITDREYDKFIESPTRLNGSAVETVVSNQSSDAFGRSRISEIRNVFEYQFRYDISLSPYWDSLNQNGATQAQDVDRKAFALNCDAQVGSKSVLQSRRRIEYTAGLSQLVKITFNLEVSSADYNKSVGLYDADNGLIFRSNGLTPEFLIRSKATGSVVDRVVSQSNWNGDKLDGTGDSGETLDLTKHQLLFIDFGYLGIGDVRFYFYINSKIILAHTFKSSNEIDRIYMQSGLLPIRFEIEAIGTPASPSSMYITCTAVASEGKKTEIGRVRAYNSGTTAILASGTETARFGLRIKDAFSYSSIEPLSFGLLAESGNSIALYRIYHNPTLSAETWVDLPNSIAQVLTNTPTITGGLLLQSGYINLSAGGKTAEFLSSGLNSDIFLGFNLNNSPDTLVFTFETVQGNGSLFLNTQWREIF